MAQPLPTFSSEPEAGLAVADAAVVPASAEAVRLAFRLRDCPTAQGGRVMLFVPASRGLDAEGIVTDVIAGLLQLDERPVLLMDLRVPGAGPGEAMPAPAPGRDRAGRGGPGAGAASLIGAQDPSLVVAHPFAGGRDPVRHAASAEFAGAIVRAKSSYAYVLLLGSAVTSVETLITAGLCDGVVLAVRPGRTTRTDIQRTTGDLRRAHAYVLGFVVDSRVSGEKGEW